MFLQSSSLSKSSHRALLGLGRFSSSVASSDDDVYDVVVVGAGMVGAALSSLLGENGTAKS